MTVAAIGPCTDGKTECREERLLVHGYIPGMWQNKAWDLELFVSKAHTLNRQCNAAFLREMEFLLQKT